MGKKKYLQLKQYITSAALFSAALGTLLYSGHYLAKEKAEEMRHHHAPKKEGEAASPGGKDEGGDTAALMSDNGAMASEPWSDRADIPLHNAGTGNVLSVPNIKIPVDPHANLNTGFSDSFKELAADEEVLHIHTRGKSSFSAGVSAQYKQEIFLDHEISSEFFSTPDFQKYIRGTVTRPGTLGSTTKSIEDDVWGKKVGLMNSETMNYDKEGQKIVYKTPNYTASMSSVTIETDLFIDLGQWRRDTNRLVERQDTYTVRSRTSSADWITIGGKGSIISVIAGDGIMDSWIENPVEDTTLYRLEEDPAYFYGNGLQDELNEHETDYLVDLLVNGRVYKEVQMEEDGSWSFDFGSYLSDTDIVTARIKGTERHQNNNGVINIKHSNVAHAENETEIIPWEDWAVHAPVISQGYQDEFIIQGTAPVQNRQLNRSYKLSVSLNGQEIYKKENLKDEADILIPYLPGLALGDVVEATITGYQEGYPSKESSSAQMIVITEDDEDYEDWVVLAPHFENPDMYEGEQHISGIVPVQNRAAERSYDLELYVNHDLVYREAGIDVSLKPHYFDTKVTRLLDCDEVTAKVVGHQDNQKDKEAETSVVVSDKTGWADWAVHPATLNPVSDADRTLNGSIPRQDTKFGRRYRLEAYVEGSSVGQIAVQENGQFSFDLPKATQLKEGEEVVVEVIGYQEGKEEKRSEQAVQLVADATNYDQWEISAPELAPVTDQDTALTGRVGFQDGTHGRTYELAAFVNGVPVGSINVGPEEGFTLHLPEDVQLQEGDEVAVALIGHQPDKKDKQSAKAVQSVSDGTGYEDWVVNGASMDALYEHQKQITGHVSMENLEHGRTYDLSVRVNDIEVATGKAESDSDYAIDLPQGTDLAENDKVTVQIIGHQPAKADKQSEATELVVQKIVYPTTSKFEVGYWESFGLVYEGQIDNEGWDLSDSSRVVKKASLVDQITGHVVHGLSVQNTDWYQAGRYNGYQLIITNEVLASLPAGQYVISMAVHIDGEVVVETDLSLAELISRTGPIHDNYGDLEQVVVQGNTVKPQVVDNKPGLSIIKNHEADLQLFNKYWNGESQLVYEGFFNSPLDLHGSRKKLIITDSTGALVHEQDGLSAAPTSWGTATGISDERTFQAIIPQEFTNQMAYSYRVVVFDEGGNELFESSIV